MFIKYVLEYKKDQKSRKSDENIYILGLDGGTFFQPMAIELLMNRMKKDPTPEAVCGRIHPFGAGSF